MKPACDTCGRVFPTLDQILAEFAGYADAEICVMIFNELGKDGRAAVKQLAGMAQDQIAEATDRASAARAAQAAAGGFVQVGGGSGGGSGRLGAAAGGRPAAGAAAAPAVRPYGDGSSVRALGPPRSKTPGRALAERTMNLVKPAAGQRPGRSSAAFTTCTFDIPGDKILFGRIVGQVRVFILSFVAAVPCPDRAEQQQLSLIRAPSAGGAGAATRA